MNDTMLCRTSLVPVSMWLGYQAKICSGTIDASVRQLDLPITGVRVSSPIEYGPQYGIAY